MTSRSSEAQGSLLLDSGDYRRLERIGGVTVSRPCPSADWSPGLPVSDWRAADISLGETGDWEGTSALSGQEWCLHSDAGFSLGLWPGPNGQIGAFPEQSPNWDWLRAACERQRPRQLRVLNLFAYTGGSSLACAAAGNTEVVHLDGARASTTRARANAERSRLTNIRWLVDDVLTYTERALRRGDKFDAVVLDPPAFGRGGPKKRDWRIERDLPRLLDLTAMLLSDEPAFILLSAHDQRWPEDRLCRALEEALLATGQAGLAESGSMVLRARGGGKSLPMGSYVRWQPGGGADR